MGWALLGLSFLISLVGFGAVVMILIHAFKADTMQGILCLCVPCYIFYYAFAQFEHEKKGIILGVWIASIFLSGTCTGIGQMLVMQDAMGDMMNQPGFTPPPGY